MGRCIDLAARAGQNSRLDAIATLEAYALALLPAGMALATPGSIQPLEHGVDQEAARRSFLQVIERFQLKLTGGFAAPIFRSEHVGIRLETLVGLAQRSRESFAIGIFVQRKRSGSSYSSCNASGQPALEKSSNTWISR